MNNDNDNLRKLAGDHPFTISIDDGYCEWSYQYRLTSAVGIGMLSRMIAEKLELPEPNGNLRRGTHQPSTLTPAPLDREAMGKGIKQEFYEALNKSPISKHWQNLRSVERLDVVEGFLSRISALLPRDGGACELAECVWIKESIMGLRNTACGHHQHFRDIDLSQFNHCPFCGKTIREVK